MAATTVSKTSATAANSLLANDCSNGGTSVQCHPHVQAWVTMSWANPLSLLLVLCYARFIPVLCHHYNFLPAIITPVAWFLLTRHIAG